MNEHKAEAIIITCIDHRIQADIEEWVSQYFKEESFDRVALGGGVKDLDVILEQIDIAVRLHHIKKVILINHEDCGAYGAEGTPEKHAADLKTAKEQVKELYPDLEVETYYLHLNGTFEPIS